MPDQEMRTVTMSRSDMFRVRQALTCMVLDFRKELVNSETTEDRRQIAKSSMAMWTRIRSEFTAQLNAQDLEEFIRK